jgi:hypothetical protein
VLSLSLGPSTAPIGNVTYIEAIALACLEALKARVLLCVYTAENTRLRTSTLKSFIPWITFVGATTIDRAYTSFLYIGDRKNYSGQGLTRKCITKLAFCQHLFQSFNMNLACTL